MSTFSMQLLTQALLLDLDALAEALEAIHPTDLLRAQIFDRESGTCSGQAPHGVAGPTDESGAETRQPVSEMGLPPASLDQPAPTDATDSLRQSSPDKLLEEDVAVVAPHPGPSVGDTSSVGPAKSAAQSSKTEPEDQEESLEDWLDAL